MAPYYSVAIIFLSLYASTGYSQVQTENGRLHIQIGTTSGCRVAQWFMSQVGTTYEKYNKYVTFEFTPWGRTTRAANGSLVCQFGEEDCWANRVHRCALNALRNNQEAMVRYMLCEFSDPFPAIRQRSMVCSQRAGVSIIAMDYCVSTPYGDALEGPAEERSRQGMTVIDLIPFIIFNHRADLDIYHQAILGLERVVCNALLADPTTSVTRC